MKNAVIIMVGSLIFTYFLVMCKVLFHLVKAVIFPVVVYGCENWTIKKVEQ